MSVCIRNYWWPMTEPSTLRNKGLSLIEKLIMLVEVKSWDGDHRLWIKRLNQGQIWGFNCKFPLWLVEWRVSRSKSDDSSNYWLAWGVFGLQCNSNLGCSAQECINRLPTAFPSVKKKPAKSVLLREAAEHEWQVFKRHVLKRLHGESLIIFCCFFQNVAADRGQSKRQLAAQETRHARAVGPLLLRDRRPALTQPLPGGWDCLHVCQASTGSGCSHLGTSSKHQWWSCIGLPG